jgi:hypothetical protein
MESYSVPEPLSHSVFIRLHTLFMKFLCESLGANTQSGKYNVQGEGIS